VIGIIGKTQGVSNDNAHSEIANQRNGQMSVGVWLLDEVGDLAGEFDAVCSGPIAGPLTAFFTSSEPEKETRTVLGGMQKVSLQS